jgi:hypothetical protein
VGPEAVAGKQHLLLLEIGHHGVRPMEHGGLQKGQIIAAQGEFAAGFDLHKGPLRLEVAAQAGLALGRAEDFLRLDPVHHFGQTPGMIHLHVIGDDIVDFLGIDDVADAAHHLPDKALFHRVDQGDLVVHDEVGVIGGPGLGAVAVKIPQGPVYGAHPIYSRH